MLKDLFVEELGAVSPVEPTGIGVPAGYERHNRRVQFIRGIEHASTQDLGRDLLEPQFDLVRYQYTISEKGRRSRWVGAVPVVAKDTERCRRRLVTRKKDEPTGSVSMSGKWADLPDRRSSDRYRTKHAQRPFVSATARPATLPAMPSTATSAFA